MRDVRAESVASVMLDTLSTLRTPEGERQLREGDVAVFRQGPDGATKCRAPAAS